MPLRAAFCELDVRKLWPAVLCLVGMLAVRCLKWHELLKDGKICAPPDNSARSLFGGFALGIITPGRTGELARCLFVPGPSRARVFLLNLLDRMLDEWALLTCAIASLFVVASRPAAVFALAVWLALLPFVLGLPGLISSLGGLPWWREPLRARIAGATESLLSVRTTRIAAWTLASTALDLMVFFFLLRTIQQVPFSVALATFPWIVMAGGLPLSLGGLGLRESAAILILARFAIPPATALAAALLLFALTALLPAGLGALWLVVRPHHQKLRGWENLETLVV